MPFKGGTNDVEFRLKRNSVVEKSSEKAYGFGLQAWEKSQA